MNNYELNSGWLIGYEELSVGILQAMSVLSDKKDWFAADLPCDVRIPLIRENIIEEPLEKLNCFDSEWVEDKSWWFLKKFNFDPNNPENSRTDLILDYLDLRGDIFLNGKHIGSHESVHYPFVSNVSSLLAKGENTLLIRVTTGTESLSREDMGDLQNGVSTEAKAARGTRGDVRRVLLRKPQYVFGWDWGPRVASCGLGNARLSTHGKTEIECIRTRTLSLSGDRKKARISLDIEIENTNILSTEEEEFSIRIKDEDGRLIHNEKTDVFLRSGINYLNRDITIENPRLWWPRGYGEPSLYTICITWRGGTFRDSMGIRTLELNQDKIPGTPGERRFSFEVNGVQIFAKGANWIPADSIWQRVDEEKYRTLIEEAGSANFNMLRVWGGGLYERDCFYRICDERGILVWQDFMFGCGLYPDGDKHFMELVSKELLYQTKRLAGHPCLALWCGNNENQWIWNNGGYETPGGELKGQRIYNRMAPEIVQMVSPHIPYWNSSPYGGDEPNSHRAGDCHYWHECMMNGEMEKRITPEEYDLTDHKFISEYGYVGPCPKESIQGYFGEEEINRQSDIWHHHNNTFEKDTVAAGIAKHYRDPGSLNLDEYLLYAGLVQGLMYQYSLESFRFKENCSGGLFWMYNDTWGETGWTIIDYYLNRKISYSFVRRAFEPVKLIMRETGGAVHIVLCNDSPDEIKGNLEYGSVRFDGGSAETDTVSVHVKGHTRNRILSFPRPAGKATDRIVFCRVNGPGGTSKACLRETEFLKLSLAAPKLAVSEEDRTPESVAILVSSDRFAHGIHFGLAPGYRLSHEYFDLLPGEVQKVKISIRKKGAPLPSIEELAQACSSVFN